MFRETLNGMEEGININDRVINNLRYADDTVFLFLADSVEDLQALINRVVEEFKSCGMKLSCGKAKVLISNESQESQQQ